MTSEEKLEALGVRVDALTQSVELLVTLHRDLERETAARFAETTAKFTETLGFISRLAYVA